MVIVHCLWSSVVVHRHRLVVVCGRLSWSVAVCGRPSSSVIVRRGMWLSVAVVCRVCGRLSSVVCGRLWSSVVVCGRPSSSVVICGRPLSSVAVRGHGLSSVVVVHCRPLVVRHRPS